MDWAGTPAPPPGAPGAAGSVGLVPPPAGWALGEEGAETFLGLGLDPQPRQTCRHDGRRATSIRGGSLRHIAYQRLGLGECSRGAFCKGLGDARAGFIEAFERNHFM